MTAPDRHTGASLANGLVWSAGLALALIAGAAVAQTGSSQPPFWQVLWKWTPLLAQGFAFNLVMSFLAMAIGTVAGFGLGMAQVAETGAVRRVAWLVTHFFRNAPWLVLLFFTMFLLPFEFRIGDARIPFPGWLKATLGLALPVMANVSEIVRGAIQSIPSGQWDSSRTLGFSRWQTMTMIILPQCLKRMLPPWMNLYAILTMATVLASVVGVADMMTLAGRVLSAEARTDLLIPVYGYVLLWFFAYCYPIARFTTWLERRTAVLQ